MPRSRRTISREDKDTRRAQIIDEAIRIVGERGYYGFTVQDLAERCGISHGTLFYHFGSKDQILIETLNEFERRASTSLTPHWEAARAAIAQGELPASQLTAFFRSMVSQATAQPEIQRLSIVVRTEALDPSHPAHQSFLEREAQGLDMFAQLFAPFSDRPRSKARQVAALLQGLSEQWVREDYGFDLLDEWDRVARDVLPATA